MPGILARILEVHALPKSLIAAAALGLALYGISIAPGNAQAESCAAAKSTVARMKPLATGEVAGVMVPADPKPLPDLAFTGPDGKPMLLSALRGKTVLLNLWATWCAPCRKEMPALDKLQAELGGADFEVVAVTVSYTHLTLPTKRIV